MKNCIKVIFVSKWFLIIVECFHSKFKFGHPNDISVIYSCWVTFTVFQSTVNVGLHLLYFEIGDGWTRLALIIVVIQGALWMKKLRRGIARCLKVRGKQVGLFGWMGPKIAALHWPLYKFSFHLGLQQGKAFDTCAYKCASYSSSSGLLTWGSSPLSFKLPVDK